MQVAFDGLCFLFLLHAPEEDQDPDHRSPFTGVYVSTTGKETWDKVWTKCCDRMRLQGKPQPRPPKLQTSWYAGCLSFMGLYGTQQSGLDRTSCHALWGLSFLGATNAFHRPHIVVFVRSFPGKETTNMRMTDEVTAAAQSSSPKPSVVLVGVSTPEGWNRTIAHHKTLSSPNAPVKQDILLYKGSRLTFHVSFKECLRGIQK